MLCSLGEHELQLWSAIAEVTINSNSNHGHELCYKSHRRISALTTGSAITFCPVPSRQLGVSIQPGARSSVASTYPRPNLPLLADSRDVHCIVKESTVVYNRALETVNHEEPISYRTVIFRHGHHQDRAQSSNSKLSAPALRCLFETALADAPGYPSKEQANLGPQREDVIRLQVSYRTWS